jgi:hypothetical protein
MSAQPLTAPALRATPPVRRAPAATEALDPRPSYGAAAIAAALVFALYVATLAPSTAMWDASEYIAAAFVLGIPHPPGNPFFVLVGRVFAVLPIGPNVATRINVLAALCSALTAGLWFLVAERVLGRWLAERWQRIVGGALAALVGATAFTVWNQSVVNEKVYTVSLLFFAIVSWLTVRWCDDPDGARADRILVLVAYLIGLGYTNHPAGFLVAPAVGVAILARRPRTLLRWRLLVVGALAFVLGLTPFAYMPIRAAHFPAINEGEPTGCTDRIAVACTFSATTADRLMATVSREQYGKPDLSVRQAPLPAQFGMWWLYFEWQWLRDAHLEAPRTQQTLAVVFLALGILGGWVHWRHDRRSFWFFGPLVFTVTVALVYYMNFKYGASQAPALGDAVPREVRDRDYFYLWSYSAWSVWVALGIVCLWRLAAERLAAAMPTRRAWLLASPLLAIAAVPMVGNWRQASRAGELATRDWAHDLLNSVEPYGVLVTAGDNDTFPLWYAQEVEGVRRDVVVAVTSLLNTDWYVRGMIRRPIHEYDAARGPAVYRDRQWPKPDSAPIDMTIAEADAVPAFTQLDGPQRFQQGGIDAVIDPARLPYGALERADVLVLHMIRDNLGKRPIYISRTAGSYGQTLGLDRHLLMQGLARKVVPTALTASRDTALVAGEGFVDVPRTTALVTDVFRAPRSIVARGDWVDKPSANIPAAYVVTSLVLGQALAQRGDTALAARILDSARTVAIAAHIMDWFGGPAQPEPPAANDAPPRVRVGG